MNKVLNKVFGKGWYGVVEFMVGRQGQTVHGAFEIQGGIYQNLEFWNRLAIFLFGVNDCTGVTFFDFP